jgi:hypothetical protein
MEEMINELLSKNGKDWKVDLPTAILSVKARFSVMKLLNQQLLDCIPFIDLNKWEEDWSLAHLLKQLSGVIFLEGIDFYF